MKFDFNHAISMELIEVRDESDRTGLRIVIDLKKDINCNKILLTIYIKILIYKKITTIIWICNQKISDQS